MKKYVFMVFLFASMIIAQKKVYNTNLDQSIAQDTINISEIVRGQIQDALEKQNAAKAQVVADTTAVSEAAVIPVAPAVQEPLPEKIKIPEQTKVEPVQSNIILNYIINQPIHIQIFAVVSVLIVFFVLFRRIITSIKRKSLNALKQKIQMLREDRVSTTVNPKLQLARKQLRGKEMVFMKSDKQISRTAKELNISKGELLLAARLKLFEVGKM